MRNARMLPELLRTLREELARARALGRHVQALDGPRLFASAVASQQARRDLLQWARRLEVDGVDERDRASLDEVQVLAAELSNLDRQNAALLRRAQGVVRGWLPAMRAQPSATVSTRG